MPIVAATQEAIEDAARALGRGGIVAFPTETAVGDVPPDIIAKLGLIYGPVVFLIWMGVILSISRYRISRTRHREMLEQLAGDGA